MRWVHPLVDSSGGCLNSGPRWSGCDVGVFWELSDMGDSFLVSPSFALIFQKFLIKLAAKGVPNRYFHSPPQSECHLERVCYFY